MGGGWRAAGACVAATALGCGGGEFLCASDDDCGSVGSACVQGYCAFPDDRCPSGLRFSEHSGSLSGMCTDAEGATDPSGSGTSTASASGSPSSPASSAEVTSAATVDPPETTTASSDGPPMGMVEFRDDELAGEFDAGTFSGVTYSASRLRLAAGEAAGTFTSRVFDAGAVATWQFVTWEPDAPYSKPLPDDNAAESGYSRGGVDMDGNVLLLHFDEPGTLGPGSIVADASGRGNDGFIESDGPSSSAIDGLFSNALDDNLDAYVSIPPGSADFDFGLEDFTWAIWVRFAHGCASNNTFIGVDDIVGGSDDFPHLWLGCTVNQWPECPRGGAPPRPGGVLRSVQSNEDDGVFYCGDGPINDGEWHHLAMVKSGHDATQVRLYVDGVLNSTVGGMFEASLDLVNDGDFGIGGFSGSTFPSQGEFDDAAIWRRALDDDEVAALYERGALRFEVELRVCQEPQCADDPAFVGGANLAAGVGFVDPPDATSPGVDIPLSTLGDGQFAQYRLRLAGPLGGASPAVAAVAMRGAYTD